MKWFGKSWGSPVCFPPMHTETPVGNTCIECEKPIKEDDQGLILPIAFQDDSLPPEAIYHLCCFINSVFPPGE